MRNLALYLLIFLAPICFAFDGGYPLDKSSPLYKNIVKLTFNNNFLCTGVVINKNSILTSAHCFDKIDSKQQLALIDVILASGEKLEVVAVNIHETYLSKSHSVSYDVAIVDVGDIFEFSTIHFARFGLELGQKVVVVGIDEERMKIISRHTHINDVNGHELLIDEGPVLLCNGDSGAPVFSVINNKYYLSAIVTKGEIGCSGQGIITGLNEIF